MPTTARDRLANLADKLGKSQTEMRAIVDAYFDDLLEHLKSEGHVSIPGIGIFKTVTRAARPGYNPFEGTRTLIPESLRVTFQPAKKTSERLGLGPMGPIVTQPVRKPKKAKSKLNKVAS